MNISDKSLLHTKKVVTKGAFACQKFPSCIIKANERESNAKLVLFLIKLFMRLILIRPG